MSRKPEAGPRAPAYFAGDDHVERLLDEALEATFPASDPVALAVDGDRTELPAQREPRAPQQMRDRPRRY